MPKLKTHRGAAKRFKKTATGKFVRSKAFKRHLLSSKTTKQKAVKSKKVWTAFVLVSFPKSSVPPLLLDRVRQNEQWYSQVKDSKSVRELESAVR